MRIVLIGPPGSGKGTQANFIEQRYKIPCVSSGGILRDILHEESQLSDFIKNTINSGSLVSNDLIIDLIKNKLEKLHDSSFMLDGFPRTVTQAHFMQSFGIVVDIALIFSMSEKLIIERVSGRCIHVPSGRVYHRKFNPPKRPGYDDITGELLVSRKDDEEKIIRNRLIEYYCHTIPVIDFYRKKSCTNTNFRCIYINCDCDIFHVQNQLIKIFD